MGKAQRAHRMGRMSRVAGFFFTLDKIYGSGINGPFSMKNHGDGFAARKFCAPIRIGRTSLWISEERLEDRMYAIVRTGGKQYQVAPGDRLRVEKIEGGVGDSVELTDVLLVADGDEVKVGKPVLDAAKVSARIVEQDRAKKILVFKKKKRKGYRLKQGHRQYYTALEIGEITV